ncbi:MAG TPA: SDR family NAD(P)-dependent oxidoreductase [Anaerolineales bacterium]|nr:SDR family NAD(P)-dependent oxidoreductase [Anaerolineales bacterium]
MQIADKVVIITGASAGIGLATARLASQKGAKVALVARSQDKLRALSREMPDSLSVRADMTKPAEIRRMIAEVKEHFGRIDILINNAGQGYDAPVEKIRLKTFRHIFNLDVVGPLIAMQKVIPIMRRQKAGMIINVSSGTALMYLPNMSPYSSLKRSLAAISLTAREELKDDGIVVSVIYPYITATDFEANTIHEVKEEAAWGEDDGGSFQPPDSAEHVAQRILDGIQREEAEIFAHDWMQQNH